MADYRRDPDAPEVLMLSGDLVYPEALVVTTLCRRIAEECKRIVFDLKDVGYINSVGLSIFALMVRVTRGAVTLRNTPDHVRRIVDKTGLNKVLKME